MAESTAVTDLVAFFTDINDNPVQAECQLSIAPGDDLMQDFQPGYFFELTGFTFSLKIGGSDKTKAGAAPTAAGQPGQATATSDDNVDSWYKQPPQPGDLAPLPVNLVEGTFQRALDAASPVFFQQCCYRQLFNTAVIVKRVSTGTVGGGGGGLSASASVSLPGVSLSASINVGGSAGGGQPIGMVRIEFNNVLITQIAWTDGDVVNESCTFSAHHMLVSYHPQDDSGAIESGTTLMAEWSDPTPPDANSDGC